MSRPEWVFLLAIFLLVLAAVLPSIAAWRRHERLVMTRHDVSALYMAILRYQREYGTWPVESTTGGPDVRYGVRRSNAELMRVLRSEVGAGNRENQLNSQRMIFIEVEPYQKGWSGINDRGEFLDPWGTPYQIVLDSNYDSAAQVENSIYGRIPGLGVLVWSCGPDRKSETHDDLLSWNR